MSDNGHFYYLHKETKDLIHKRVRPESDSPFVERVWELDPTDRFFAWQIAVEALALGAREDRVRELQAKWGLTDEDAQKFAELGGLKLFRDGDQWCAAFEDFVDIQESQAGFGEDCLHALADLARHGLAPSSVHGGIQ